MPTNRFPLRRALLNSNSRRSFLRDGFFVLLGRTEADGLGGPVFVALYLCSRDFGALLGERDDVRGGTGGVEWVCEDGCGGGGGLVGWVGWGGGGMGKGD